MTAPRTLVPPIDTADGPATTAAWRAQNENPGPLLKIVGYGFLLLAFGVAALVAYSLIVAKTPINWAAFGLVAALLVAALLLIRPPGLDGVIKTVADRLPSIPYTKPAGQ